MSSLEIDLGKLSRHNDGLGSQKRFDGVMFQARSACTSASPPLENRRTPTLF
jgi:hypothetical protein